MAKPINKIYIAGALTHVSEVMKPIYEKIAALCDPLCDNVYVPHLRTDPIAHPDVVAQEVWQKNEREVSTARLTIAYVGEPSLGTGAELEIARIAGKDIILWWFKNQRVTRMTLGNPAIVEKIEAEDEQDLYNKLKNVLEQKYGH